MAKVKFVELEGNPTFTDRNIVANVEKQFLNAARKNPGVTWVVREQGFGKQGRHQWSQARKDVYVLGATKTKKEYWARKALGNKKGGLPKYDPQKAVPRTTAAATFYHAAHRENQNLQRELSLSNLSDSERNTEYHKRKINVQVERVRSSDIKYFQEQGEGKKSYALAAKARDKRIKKITGAGVRITQGSGEFEGKNERHARLMFEGVQEGRAAAKLSYLDRVAKYGLAEDGQPKLVPNNIKVTDEFIDAINARSFGTVKEERAFKSGALKFLQNKEAFQQIQTPQSSIFTPQRLEDTRSWHSGSTISSFDSAIPNYVIPDLNKVDTKFVGSTLINALSRSGPETGETTIMGDPSADSDFGRDIDAEIFDARSSFVNMLPDEIVPGQEFNYNIESDKVPVQITTSAEELQLRNEPTIHETVVERTQGGTWGWENSQQATNWEGYPGRIYDAKLIDTGKTAADLNLKPTSPVQYAPRSPENYYSLAPYPHDVSSLISSSISRTVDKGTPEHDAVQDFLKGSAATDGDVADSGGIKPTIKREVAPGLEDTFNEGTDMINIGQEAAKGWKGRIALTDAYPNLGTTSSNTSVVYGKGHKKVGGEKGYSPTPDEFKRQQRIDAMTPTQKKNALIQYGTFMNQKESEYNARVASGTNETFIQDLRNKKGTIATDSSPTNIIDDVDSWQDIGPAPKPAVVPVPKGDLGIPGATTRPSYVPDLNDSPYNVYEGGETPTAEELGLPVDEIKAHNERVDARKKIAQSEKAFGPRGKPVVTQPKAAIVPVAKSRINSKKPTQLTEFDLIELKKSKVLSKKSGKPTFTTKDKKVKAAVKQGAKLLKGPGSTTLNALSAFTLISPLIGAFGAVVKEQKREEESQAAYPLHPPKQKTLWSRFANMESKDFSQALMHRLAPEEIYGKEGYPSLKKVKEWRKNSKGYGT